MKVYLKALILITLVSLSFTGKGQDKKQAYQLFDAKGKKANYKALLKKSLDSDIVFFGELHNNPISHWLQYELTKDIIADKKQETILGAEMFEADNQIILDEYLTGKISEKSFKSEARLWSNYNTDYAPLIELAKKNSLPFIASNIPRRYANMVYSGGFEQLDSIDNRATKWIAPLPIKYNPELKGYKKMVEMAGGHGGENLPKAQAIKDATMAHFILKNFQKNHIFIHYNGSYHSDQYEGIVWYIKQQNPDLKVMTIATVEQSAINQLEKKNKEKADFILVVPKTMTKTY